MGASTDFMDIVNAPLPGEGVPQQREVIGGFDGFDGANPNLGGSGQNAPAGGRRSASEGPQPYYLGDEYAILKGMTVEDRVRLQQQLVSLGLASNVTYGEIDGGETGQSGTLGAMRRLLAMANASGDEWVNVLNRIATNPAMQDGADEYEPAPNLTPDYASIAQDIKSEFRQRLGRDPDDYELQQLAGQMTGFYADEYAAQEEFRQLQHEAQTTPGVQGGGTVGRVDPMARFREVFDERFGAELAEPDKERQAQLSQESVQGGAQMVADASRRSF